MRIVAVAISFFLLLHSSQSQGPTRSQAAEAQIKLQADKFKSMLQTAYSYYPDSVDVDRICEAAFAAMFRELDPYSVYFPPERYKSVSDSYKGSTEGIGVNIFLLKDTIVVTSVVPHSPADSAGIRPGDRIISVDGVSVIKKPINDVTDRLNGAVNSLVSIGLRRGPARTFLSMNITRKEYPLSSLSAGFVIPGTKTGYIKMSRFSHTSETEFIEAAEALVAQNINTLIYDLRGNQGGYLEEACTIADQFIPGGRTITYTAGKDSSFYKVYKSRDRQILEKIPVIILIDGVSASASEIIAGAIQDLDRGLILGEISYGKGMAQKVWEFKDSSAFRITVAKYFTPSGRCIQKNYNSPDITPDPAMKLAMGDSAWKNLEAQLKKTGGRASMEVFKTEKGRFITGGGGIRPDYFVKDDSTSVLTQVLKSKGIILECTYNFLEKNRESIIEDFRNDPAVYSELFQISDDMLDELSSLAKARNTWNEKMYATDREYIRTFVKANIAHAIWGNPGFYTVLVQNDKPVQKALELLPQAEEMLIQ